MFRFISKWFSVIILDFPISSEFHSVTSMNAAGKKYTVQEKKPIIVFAKYFGYRVGGAEISMFEMTKKFEREGHQISVLLNTAPTGYNAKSYQFDLPKSWSVHEYKPAFQFTRFPFLEFVFLYPFMQRFIRQFEGDVIWLSYGYWAAMLSWSKQQKIVSFRDVTSIGCYENVNTDWRWFIKLFLWLSEYPALFIWHHHMKRTVQKAKVITNSEFIKSKVMSSFNPAEISVIYPEIDQQSLRKQHSHAIENLEIEKGVVHVGASQSKGIDITLYLAQQYPEQVFHVFDRKYTALSKQQNIYFHPWSNSGQIFALADVVIVPSRCSEAYGRVSAEARCLSIPVLVSGKGGLSETVSDKNDVVIPPADKQAWVKALSNKLDGLTKK